MSLLRRWQIIFTLLFYLLGRSTSATSDSYEPISLYNLPTSYPFSLKLQDADIQNQIHNTLAHYPLAIDGKNFGSLDLVFAKDAIANYSAPLGILTGLDEIKTVLQRSLSPVLSQHMYGTQLIEIEKGRKTAKSVTYFTANHFGVGNATGKVSNSVSERLIHLAEGGSWIVLIILGVHRRSYTPTANIRIIWFEFVTGGGLSIETWYIW